MSVYVDDAYIQASVKSGSATHKSRWCHMTADTREELDAFALRLGLQKRALAVRLGAVEITWRDGARQSMAKGRALRVQRDQEALLTARAITNGGAS